MSSGRGRITPFSPGVMNSAAPLAAVVTAGVPHAQGLQHHVAARVIEGGQGQHRGGLIKRRGFGHRPPEFDPVRHPQALWRPGGKEPHSPLPTTHN